MNTYTIDNSCHEELDRTITWQFDQSTNLIAVVNLLEELGDGACGEFWDRWNGVNTSLKDADDYGLALFGTLFGIKRPDFLTTENYRKILTARAKVLCRVEVVGGVTVRKKATVPDIIEYFHDIFGEFVKVTDNLDMTVAYELNDGAEEGLDEDLYRVFTEHKDIVTVFPAGVRERMANPQVVFGLEGQQDSDFEVGGLDESNFIRRND